jgi:F-type H+-transporting ATPase subunit b
MLRPFRINACELKNKVGVAGGILLALTLLAPVAATAQTPEHKPAAADHAPPAPGGEHAADAEHAEGESHGTFSGLLWPTVNFVILAGGLWWFFKDPVASYLRDRHTSIRQDLVDAAAIKSAAAAQLAEIDRKLQALPGEIAALKTRGAEEIAAEEQRIAAQAAAERDRLLEQTRREIDVQLRLAKRELVEHAATLSVQLASDRLQQQMTPDDQQRLVDRYVDQVSTRPV